MKAYIWKILSLVTTIVYGIVSLFWCYVLVRSLVYSLSALSMNSHGIGLICVENSLWLLMVIFILSTFTTDALGMISTVNKRSSWRLHIVVSVFATLSFLVFLLIPPQTYAVEMYILVKHIGGAFVGYMRQIYIAVTLAMIGTHIVCGLKRRPEL